MKGGEVSAEVLKEMILEKFYEAVVVDVSGNGYCEEAVELLVKELGKSNV